MTYLFELNLDDNHPEVTELTVTNESEDYTPFYLPDLTILEHFPNLRVLKVSALSELESLRGLELLPNLEELTLHRVGRLRDYEALKCLTRLQTLNLFTDMPKLASLPVYPELKRLDILNLEVVGDLRSFPNLRSLAISGSLHDLSCLSQVPQLEVLELSYGSRISSWTGLRHLPELRRLDVSSSRTVGLQSFPVLPKLEVLAIWIGHDRPTVEVELPYQPALRELHNATELICNGAAIPSCNGPPFDATHMQERWARSIAQYHRAWQN